MSATEARMSACGVDPFAWIQVQTDAHRASHGCWAYPFQDGPSLGVLSGATRPARILELGTALGYTACWLAHGHGPAHVETIERDPVHVRLARDNIRLAGLSGRITVRHGDFGRVLARLTPGFGLVLFDGYAPSTGLLDRLRDLMAPCGVLITANLGLGESGSDLCAEELADPVRWLTSYMAEQGRTAVSLKR